MGNTQLVLHNLYKHGIYCYVILIWIAYDDKNIVSL